MPPGGGARPREHGSRRLGSGPTHPTRGSSYTSRHRPRWPRSRRAAAGVAEGARAVGASNARPRAVDAAPAQAIDAGGSGTVWARRKAVKRMAVSQNTRLTAAAACREKARFGPFLSTSRASNFWDTMSFSCSGGAPETTSGGEANCLRLPRGQAHDLLVGGTRLRPVEQAAPDRRGSRQERHRARDKLAPLIKRRG
jgi:hypothetical protein